MRNFLNTWAFDSRRTTPLASLRFEKDHDLINKVKSHKSAVWNQNRGFWYIPQSELKMSKVFDRLSSQVNLQYSGWLGHESSKTTEIYPVGNYNLIWQLSTTTDFSNGVNTHVSQKDFAKFKNPLDDNFFDDG